MAGTKMSSGTTYGPGTPAAGPKKQSGVMKAAGKSSGTKMSGGTRKGIGNAAQRSG